MTRQVEPRESKAVIERVRAVNPVPGIERPTPEQVDVFLLDVMERTDMVQDISKQGTEQRLAAPKKVPGWLVFAASFALVVAVAVPVLIWGNDGSAVAELPSDQAEVVTGVVEAINQENLEAFASYFGPEGGAGFEFGIHRPYHQGVEGGQEIPVTDAEGFEANFLWGAALDLRLDLETCQSQSDRILRCEGSVSYEALRTGWLASVSVALDEAGDIALFATEPLNADPDPDEAPQELTFVGFYEEFLPWLEQKRPDEFERLVEPGTPGSIGGVEIQLTVPPQNPDLVADMTTLIDEYLQTH